MSGIFFKAYEPNKFLCPYVSRIFIFESNANSTGVQGGIIAPNGRIKIVIPYKGGMKSKVNDLVREHKEFACSVVGVFSYSSNMEYPHDYGCVTVEFTPIGAYKFFQFPLNEITNQIYNMPDLYGRIGIEFQKILAEITDNNKKIQYVEDFLLKQMALLNKFEPIVEYAVKKIIANRGLIMVDEISRETGYSRRYLLKKFTEHVGVGTKEFADIIRFFEVFKSMNQTNAISVEQDNYYDQSHFIKSFKKFTQMTPGEYISMCNKLGILHVD